MDDGGRVDGPGLADELRALLAFDGFILGLKVFNHALAGAPPDGLPLDFWQVVTDVADGNLTLFETAAEAALNHPGVLNSYDEKLNILIARQRALAAMVVSARAEIERAFGV